MENSTGLELNSKERELLIQVSRGISPPDRTENSAAVILREIEVDIHRARECMGAGWVGSTKGSALIIARRALKLLFCMHQTREEAQDYGTER